MRHLDRRFVRIAERVEGFVIRVVILSLVVLVVGQSISGYPAWLAVFSDRLEGIPYAALPDTVPVATDAGYRVTFLLVGEEAAPGLVLQVDDDDVARFTAARVDLRVQEGDRLSLHAEPGTPPLAVRVVYADPRLLLPAAGSEFRVAGGTVSVGVVALAGGTRGAGDPGR